jgi:amidase
MLGKSNTPEFGAGSQTFNTLFGPTRNPYDLSRTCGGSSGGSAVALACGMSSLADGTDLGGSLRNPAAFCNVVGFRPTPGLTPAEPDRRAWSELEVSGPMGRTVQDVALLTSVLAEQEQIGAAELIPRWQHLRHRLAHDFRGTLIAWCNRFAGLPFDPAVLEVFNAQRPAFECIGCRTEEACPNMAGADMAFKVFRARVFHHALADLLDEHPESLKETVVWNIEQGRRLTADELAAAHRTLGKLRTRIIDFFMRYRFLVLPTTQVPPFDIEQPYVTEIAGRRLETYIDWMASCYYISLLGLPAISVPAGFTPAGLPVGLQIVGPPTRDLAVLQLAYAYQESTGWWQRRPALP